MALRRGVCGALGCEASEKLRRREVRDGRVAMGVVLCPWRSMSVSRGGVEDAWAWSVGRVNRTLGGGGGGGGGAWGSWERMGCKAVGAWDVARGLWSFLR